MIGQKKKMVTIDSNDDFAGKLRSEDLTLEGVKTKK